MSIDRRPDWLSWGLVIVLAMLTTGVVVNVHMTLDLTGRLDAMEEQQAIALSIPCRAIPVRLVLEEPACAQKLLESMAISNVRILPRGSTPPDYDEGLEIARNLSERYARWMNRTNRSTVRMEQEWRRR